MISTTSPLEYLAAVVLALLIGALFGLYLAWSGRRASCAPCRPCGLNPDDLPLASG